MFGKKKFGPYRLPGKKNFMVRVVHADSFVNFGPFTLAEAREQGVRENERWVKYWHDHSTGSRPLTEIWEIAEVVNAKVHGVDQF